MADTEPTLRELLRAQGVSAEEMQRAADDGTLLFLAIDRFVFDEPRYTTSEIFERSPIDDERTSELWRSLGFPDPPEDEPFFTDADVQILGVLSDMVQRGASDLDLLIGMTRVIGQSMARFAAAQAEIYTEREVGEVHDTPDGTHGAAGVSNGVDPLDDPLLARTISEVLPTIPHILDYVWRRHMQAAARNRLLRSAAESSTEEMAIGFADLVGFTALSQQISPQDLAGVVDRFEMHAYDTVARLGGRVIKMIGDEVMFAVDDPRKALLIALELSDVYRNDDELSEVRVGVSWGPVLEREGDCYGPVVNQASRIVNIAFAGTVVVSEELHEMFAEDPAFRWKSLHRKTLKDIGRVTLWSVRADDAEETEKSTIDRARARRSERVEQEVERLTSDTADTREARRARREKDKQAMREASARAQARRRQRRPGDRTRPSQDEGDLP